MQESTPSRGASVRLSGLGSTVLFVFLVFVAARIVWAQYLEPRARVCDSLTVLKHALPSGGLQIVVVEPQTRVLCAYHLDPQSGVIALKSVRNISWDLYLEEFNGAPPAPKDIKDSLEKR